MTVAPRIAQLTVLRPGLASLLVDFGRPHSRGLGVPVGGATDRAALSIGNALLGNRPEAVGLELNLAGPVLRTDADVAAVVYGAPFRLRIHRQSIESGKTFTLREGETLHVGGTRSGMRAYLCVAGGFLAARLLESCSALQPLQAGDVLRCASGTAAGHFLQEEFDREQPNGLRCLPGRQAAWFGGGGLTRGSYTVLPESNRMGLRLAGKPLAFRRRELLSEPVCPGTVQVTNDGQCIILGRDGQTIGGYPKIAQVIGADLDKLAQLRPGTMLRFEPVELAVAERLTRERALRLDNWLLPLRTAAAAVY